MSELDRTLEKYRALQKLCYKLEAENSKLREQVKVMRDEMTWIYEQLKPGTGWDSDLCCTIYAVVKDTLTKVEELEK